MGQSAVLRESQDPEVEAAVTWLDEAGLAAPAYLLLHGLRPLSFVGGQGLLFVQPMLPFGKWRLAAERWAALLEDRCRLERLLQALEACLSSPRSNERQERAG